MSARHTPAQSLPHFRLVLSALLLIVGSAAATPPDPEAAPPPTRRALLNGMIGMLLPGSGDEFLLRLAIAGGSAFDPPGKSGTADLAARAVVWRFNALTNPPAGMSPLRHGVAYDVIWFELRAPEGQLIPLTEALAEALRMSELEVGDWPDLIDQPMLTQVTREDHPPRVAHHAWMHALFHPFPYAYPPEGIPATLRSIERRDILAYHRRCLLPNRAVLALAANMAEPDFRAYLAYCFGPWLRVDPPPHQFAPPRPAGQPRTTHTRIPAATEGALCMGAETVPLRHEDHPALVVLAELLSYRLTKLADRWPDTRFSVEASAWMLRGAFQVLATRPGPVEPALALAVDAEIDHLTAGEFSLDEFEAARDRVAARFAARFADPASRISLLVEAETRRAGIRPERRWMSQLADLIKEDLPYVARQHLGAASRRYAFASAAEPDSLAWPDPLQPVRFDTWGQEAP